MTFSLRVAASNPPGKGPKIDAKPPYQRKHGFRLTEGLSLGRLVTVRSNQCPRLRPASCPAFERGFVVLGLAFSRQLTNRHGANHRITGQDALSPDSGREFHQ